MNYQEKYKEALDRAKGQLDGAKVFDYNNEQIAHDIRSTVYNIFPELKESEDEKIRKWLIAQLKITIGDNATLDMIDKAISWLEKQGEQKPVEYSLTLEEFKNAFITKAKQYDIDLPNRSWDIHALCEELYSLKHQQKQGE